MKNLAFFDSNLIFQRYYNLNFAHTLRLLLRYNLFCNTLFCGPKRPLVHLPLSMKVSRSEKMRKYSIIACAQFQLCAKVWSACWRSGLKMVGAVDIQKLVLSLLICAKNYLVPMPRKYKTTFIKQLHNFRYTTLTYVQSICEVFDNSVEPCKMSFTQIRNTVFSDRPFDRLSARPTNLKMLLRIWCTLRSKL